jgi:nucleoside-diphosphate-sugar epimerase
MRVFVAGATGVIGKALLPLLLQAGHAVVGMTRSPERAGSLESLGAEAAVVDAFDRDALGAAVAQAAPDVVIHQLTDLSRGFTTADLLRNERLRTTGTRNLVDACLTAGAPRLIAQSAAWLYAGSPLPHQEAESLPLPGAGDEDATLRGIRELERLVLGTAGLTGIALRYGFLYGPGTGAEREATPLPHVSVEGAARAALLAIDHGSAGAYNVVDDDPAVTNGRARRELGWQP